MDKERRDNPLYALNLRKRGVFEKIWGDHEEKAWGGRGQKQNEKTGQRIFPFKQGTIYG